MQKTHKIEETSKTQRKGETRQEIKPITNLQILPTEKLTTMTRKEYALINEKNRNKSDEKAVTNEKKPAEMKLYNFFFRMFLTSI